MIAMLNYNPLLPKSMLKNIFGMWPKTLRLMLLHH